MKIIFNACSATVVMNMEMNNSGKVIFYKTKRCVLLRKKLGMSDIQRHPEIRDGIECRPEALRAFAQVFYADGNPILIAVVDYPGEQFQLSGDEFRRRPSLIDPEMQGRLGNAELL